MKIYFFLIKKFAVYLTIKYRNLIFFYRAIIRNVYILKSINPGYFATFNEIILYCYRSRSVEPRSELLFPDLMKPKVTSLINTSVTQFTAPMDDWFLLIVITTAFFKMPGGQKSMLRRGSRYNTGVSNNQHKNIVYLSYR